MKQTASVLSSDRIQQSAPTPVQSSAVEEKRDLHAPVVLKLTEADLFLLMKALGKGNFWGWKESPPGAQSRKKKRNRT
jgi:hypothetical protein